MSHGTARSRRNIALLAMLILVVPAGALRADDGPMIGVQIGEGPLEREVSAGAGKLRVEWPGGREEIPSGTATLRATEAGVQLGSIDFGTDIPFRFRGTTRTTRVGERVYEGWIEWLPPQDAKDGRLVNRLPLEKYLLGVLPGEMPAGSYPRHALGAQAVAARTYALFQILSRPPDARVHVRDDTHSQVYLGGGAPHPRAVEAVEETHGEVLLYDGQVFESFFHSTCGGATRAVEDCFGGDPIAPLSSVPCRGCVTSKYYRWEATIEEKDLREALTPVSRRHRIELGEVLSIEPIEPAPGGHSAYVRIVHAGGAFELDADRFRRACRSKKAELRSTSFIVERRGRDFHFIGRGWGHGVGLCQVGAKGYAEQDAGYAWILRHYYPGAEVTTLWR